MKTTDVTESLSRMPRGDTSIIHPFVFVRSLAHVVGTHPIVNPAFAERLEPVWIAPFELPISHLPVLDHCINSKPIPCQTLERWTELPFHRVGETVIYRPRIVGIRYVMSTLSARKHPEGEIEIITAKAFGYQFFGVHVPSTGALERFDSTALQTLIEEALR